MPARYSLSHAPSRAALTACVAATSFLAVGSGCRERAAEAQAPPPPTVTVVRAKTMTVPIEVETTGTTRAEREVTIRARVQGFLQEQNFQDGQNVEANQVLFVIDEAPFQARLEMAQGRRDEAAAALEQARNSKAVSIAAAQLALGQAQLAFAQVEETRAARLLQRNSMSREEYDQRKAELQQAQADVLAKQASLEQAQVTYDSDIALAQARLVQAESELTQAQLDLSYCRMSAPIAGRIGAAQIKVGNYVGSVGQVQADPLSATPLATIAQLHPIEVEIRPSARYLPESTALVRKGLNVRLLVEGMREHPYEGRVNFIDNVVDPSTSTFLVKAIVPNPEEALLPGEYVKVLMTIGEYPDIVVVPEESVIETQAGSVVSVVGDDGRVATRRVQALETYKGLRVIDSGLEPGQRVIVAGLQMARPGTLVQVEETDYGPRDLEPTADQAARSRRREAILDAIRGAQEPPRDAPTAPASEPEATEHPVETPAASAPAEAKPAPTAPADEAPTPPAA